MQFKPQNNTPRLGDTKGYALITVLFILSIIALLYAITQSRNLEHAIRLASETQLSKNLQSDDAILDFVSVHLKNTDPKDVDCSSMKLTQVIGQKIHCQNLAGLVDVNTANQKIVVALIEYLGGGDETQANYLKFRQSGRKFLRNADFKNIVFDGTDIDNLDKLITTQSGLQKVNPNLLLSDLGKFLIDRVESSNFQNDLFSARIAVFLQAEGSERWLIGTAITEAAK